MDVFDIRYLRINKLLLSYIGLWPFQPSVNTYNRLLFYFIVFCVLIILLPQITYLFKHMKNLDDFYDTLPSFIGVIICFMKIIAFHHRYKIFKVLIQHVRDDWCSLAKNENIRILMEYSERSRTFTRAYLIFIIIGTVGYATSPITISIFDLIMGSNVTRPKRLPYSTEFFVDLEKHYYTLLAISYMGFFACSLIVIAIDTIYFVLLQHTCGMFAILSHCLESLTTSESSKQIDYNFIYKYDKAVEHIVQCIQLQFRIERLIHLIESTFSMCVVADLGLGILFQCSSCVMIASRMNAMEMIKNGSLLLLQSSRIFLNSWMGQRLTDHSSKISLAAYNGMWYQSSLKVKKMLLFLIMRCQKPHRMTMAKLYVISLEGYSMVMRTSVSYITLMMSLNSGNM